MIEAISGLMVGFAIGFAACAVFGPLPDEEKPEITFEPLDDWDADLPAYLRRRAEDLPGFGERRQAE